MGVASSKKYNVREDSKMEVAISDSPTLDISDMPCQIDVILAQKSWAHIMNSTSPVYCSLLNNADFEFTTCFAWFFTCFFERLFAINSSIQEYFLNKGIESESRALIGMISVMQMQLRDPDNFKSILSTLAERHHERGVHSSQYRPFGAALFWSLRKCLGDTEYCDATHSAWKKLFSSVLRVVIPIASKLEHAADMLENQAIRFYEGDSSKKYGSQKTSRHRNNSFELRRVRSSGNLFAREPRAKDSVKGRGRDRIASRISSERTVADSVYNTCKGTLEGKRGKEKTSLSSHFVMSSLCCSHSSAVMSSAVPKDVLFQEIRSMDNKGVSVPPPPSPSDKGNVSRGWSSTSSFRHTSARPEESVPPLKKVPSLIRMASLGNVDTSEDGHPSPSPSLGVPVSSYNGIVLSMKSPPLLSSIVDMNMFALPPPSSHPIPPPPLLKSPSSSWHGKLQLKPVAFRNLSVKTLFPPDKDASSSSLGTKTVEIREKEKEKVPCEETKEPSVAPFPPVALFLTPAMRTNILTFSRMSLLKRRALMLLAQHCFSPSDVYNLVVLYNRIDMNCQGSICVADIGLAMVFQGEGHLLDELQHHMTSMGVDQDDRIEYSEFRAAVLDPSYFSMDRNISWIFHRLDRDDIGYLTFEGLSAQFEDDSRGFSREAFVEADLDLDGVVSFPEFHSMMRHIPVHSSCTSRQLFVNRSPRSHGRVVSNPDFSELIEL